MVTETPTLAVQHSHSVGAIMGHVVSRFRVLLAEKELRERRTISLRDVARDTGISIYTVSGFANNTLREVPLDAVSKLCRYFGITPGELFALEAEDDEEILSPALAAA